MDLLIKVSITRLSWLYIISVLLCLVAGSAPEGERSSIAATALQSHVSD